MKLTTDQDSSKSFTLLRIGALLPLMMVAVMMSSCSSSKTPHAIMVSVADQKVALMENGKPIRIYSCSTSKFGLGDKPGSNATPVGKLRVASKIGNGLPAGAVLHGRRPTGEVLRPNAPGRDPIVSRILWLQGCERQNCKAFDRFIYIHGTAEERNIGRPASYGCIRMKSKDVIDLYNKVPVGLEVNVVKGSLRGEAAQMARAQEIAAATPPPTPAPILPPMEPAARPNQSSTSASLAAKNGKPRMGPPIVQASKSGKTKRSMN